MTMDREIAKIFLCTVANTRGDECRGQSTISTSARHIIDSVSRYEQVARQEPSTAQRSGNSRGDYCTMFVMISWEAESVQMSGGGGVSTGNSVGASSPNTTPTCQRQSRRGFRPVLIARSRPPPHLQRCGLNAARRLTSHWSTASGRLTIHCPTRKASSGVVAASASRPFARPNN
jgi:hypothetical protein